MINSDLRGAPRIVAQAAYVVPGVGDQVWLVNPYERPTTAQSLDVPSGEHGPMIALPKATSLVVEDTDRGLLLLVGESFHYDFELWEPGSPPVVLAHARDSISESLGAVLAADADIVVLGSGCHTDSLAFLAQVCDRLTVIDLARGYRWSLPAPSGSRGWITQGRGAQLATEDRLISPTDRTVAVPVELGYDRTRLYVLSLSPANHSPVLVPDSIAPTHRNIAWTTHGDWLLYTGGIVGSDGAGRQTSPDDLRAYQLGGSTQITRIPCCQFGTMLSVP